MIQAVAIAALVLTAGPAVADLPAAPTLNTSLCAQSAPLEMAKADFDPGVGELDTTCSTDCAAYNDVSCTASGSCQAVDRNCPSERGYVECNGVRTYCRACDCTNGEIKWSPRGSCCSCYASGGEKVYVYECINGAWTYQFTDCFPNPACPLCP